MRIAPDINEFFVEGGNQEISHALLHITEPSSPEEEKKGYFFAVAEIEKGSTEQVEHLQKMIDDLESGYYATDSTSATDPFEATLEFINRRGHHILESGSAGIHCFVGVIRGSEIIFAYHGKPSVQLFYKNKDGLAFTNVIEDDNTSSRQLFSSIVQGAINPGDYFLVTTPQVSEHFNSDRLTKLLSSRSSKETIEHIEKVLRDLRKNISFAGLLITVPERKFSPATIKSSPSDSHEDSVAKLVTSEKNTDEILSPSLFGDTRKKLQTLINKPKSTEDDKESNYRPRKASPAQGIAGTILIAIGKALVIGSVGILHIVKNTAIWLLATFRNIFYIITNYKQKRHEIIVGWKRNMHHRRLAFKALPLLSKILLLGSIIFLICFIGAITYYRWRANSMAAEAAYASQVDTIKRKLEEADGSIIYNNNEQAFVLLKEAQNLIQSLPNNSLEQKNTSGSLAGDADASLRKIRKFITPEMNVFYKLSDFSPLASATLLAPINDSILAYSPDSKTLYSLDLSTKKILEIPHDTVAELRAASTPKEQDRIVFLSGASSVAEYSTDTNTLTSKPISFSDDNVKLNDLFVYNQRLYALDAGGKHIYRHSRTQTGYDQGSDWAKDGHEYLEKAVSMAIDGDVYVLTDKDVVRFQSGKSQMFPLIGLDPPLQNPTKIWTYNDVNNIYILEPANKRVIVITKEGKLLAQYTSPLWNNPTGMVVREDKKTVYVLDSNIIYQFSI